MPGSLNWEDPDYDDEDPLPLSTADRASTNLRSPSFQKPKPDATVANAAAASNAMPAGQEAGSQMPEVSAAPPVERVREVGQLPEVRPKKLLHRRYVDDRAEQAAQQRDQGLIEQDLRRQERDRREMETNLRSADPFQGPDGRWKKHHVDGLTGTVSEIDLDAAGLYKTDQKTGEKLIKTSAGYVSIGTDEAVAGRAKLLENRRMLRLQQAEAELNSEDIRAQLIPIRDQLKTFGKTPQEMEKHIAAARAGINPDKPDKAAQERLEKAERQYQEWKVANPGYSQAVEQMEALKGQLRTSDEEKRQKKRQALELQTIDDYIRRTGVLPTQPVEIGDRRSEVSGSVSATEVNRIATEIAAKNSLSQRAATRMVLKRAQNDGATMVGNVPIAEAIAKIDAGPAELPYVDKAPAFDPVKEYWRSLWSHTTTVGNSFMGGVASLGSGLLSTVALVSSLVGGGKTEDSAAMALAEEIDDYWTRGMDPEWADSAVSKVGQGIGSALTFLAPGGVVGKVLGNTGKAAKVAQFSVQAALGAITNGGSEFMELKKQGLSDDEAIVGSLGAYVLGLTEPLGVNAMGLTKLYSKLNKATGGSLTRYTSALLREMAGNAAEEAAQEGVQQLGSAAWQKLKGIGENKNKSWSELGMEAAESSAFGAINGLLFSVFVGGAARRDARMMAGKHRSEAPAVAASYLELHAMNQGLRGKIQTAADQGDADALAAVQDEALKTEGALHQASNRMLAGIDPDIMETTARVVAPELDQEQAGKMLRESPAVHFASMEMGRSLRDLYVTEEKQSALEKAQSARGANPAVAQAATDQMVGLLAVNDLRTVLTGGTIEQAKADALGRLGFLESIADPDGKTTMRVTDDALLLFPPILRDTIAKDPSRFAFTATPGAHGDLINSLVKAGQARMAQAATALVPKAKDEGGGMKAEENGPAAGGAAKGAAAPAAQPAAGGQFDVVALSSLPGSAGKSEDRFTITARDQADAEKQARARVEKGGRKVVSLKVTPKAAKKGKKSEDAGIEFAERSEAERAAERARDTEEAAGYREFLPDVVRVAQARVVEWVRKYRQAFSSVDASKDASNSAGLAYNPGTNSFMVRWDDLIVTAGRTYQMALQDGASEQEASEQARRKIDSMLDEELRHVADVRANTDEETIKLWKQLPDEVQDSTKRIYSRDNPAADLSQLTDLHWGREFKRLLSQATGGQQVSELAEVTQVAIEQAKAGKKGWVQSLVDHLQRMVDWLKSAGDTEVHRQLDALRVELERLNKLTLEGAGSASGGNAKPAPVVTFNGQPVTEIRSPGGGKVAYAFKTAQGSEYVLTEDGMTQRVKSKHANTQTDDSGLKEWMPNIRFADPASRINHAVRLLVEAGKKIRFTESNGNLSVEIHENGTWRQATMADAFPKAVAANTLRGSEEVTGKVSATPELGTNVMEWTTRPDGTVQGYHPGSPVSEISYSPSKKASPSPAVSKSDAPGTLRIVTPTGNKVAMARWRIVDANTLLTSDKPGYNPELQRRNRGRAASKAQVADIEFNLDPERLGPSATSDTGSPIINGEGMVLSGNGRSAAIRNAYGNGSKKAEAYRAFVQRMAAENGLEADLAAARNPVLVREITSYEGTNETEFADLSNRAAILGRSDVERALDDARLIEDNDLWKHFAPGEDGSVLTASNRDFNRLFVHLAGDGAELLKGNGAFTPALETRIKRAVLAALMKDQPDAMEQVTTALERAGDVGLRRQFDGVMAGAGRLLALKRSKPEMDISAELGRALRGAIEAKALIDKGQANNAKEALDNASLLEQPSEGERLLTLAILRTNSAKAVREMLGEFADKAETVDAGPTMFGDEIPTATKEDILRGIVEREQQQRERVNATEDQAPPVDAERKARAEALKAKPPEGVRLASEMEEGEAAAASATLAASRSWFDAATEAKSYPQFQAWLFQQAENGALLLRGDPEAGGNRSAPGIGEVEGFNDLGAGGGTWFTNDARQLSFYGSQLSFIEMPPRVLDMEIDEAVKTYVDPDASFDDMTEADWAKLREGLLREEWDALRITAPTNPLPSGALPKDTWVLNRPQLIDAKKAFSKAKQGPLFASRTDTTTKAAQAMLTKLAGEARAQLRPEFLAAAESETPAYPNLPDFPHVAGLDRESRLIEAHFAQQIADNPELAFRQYAKLAAGETGTVRYINPDLAREVYAPYADRAARLVLERGTVNGAGYICNRLAWDRWMEVGPTNERPDAIFLGGGPGSGKSTATKAAIPEAKESAGVLYDNTMSTYPRARALIEAALDRGFAGKMLFVYRPFDLAIEGAIDRMAKENRPVPARLLAEIHYNAQEVFLRLARDLGDRMTFKVLLNTGRKEDIRAGAVAELERIAYSNNADETENRQGNRTSQAAQTPESDPDQSGEDHGLRRSRGGGSAEADQGRQTPAESPLLTLSGSKAERIEQLTARYAAALDKALESGRITLAQWQVSMTGSTVDTSNTLGASRTLAAKNAKVTGPGLITLAASRAHHGTPHKVDRFSLDKIGTGEGAQAYGWGLYFAENEEVGKEYRKGLTERDFVRKVQEVYDEYDDPAEAVEALKTVPLSEGQRALLKVLEDEGWWGFDYPHQAVRAAIREPENFDPSPEFRAAMEKFGNLYTVELDVEQDELLDWDKPLAEQSEKVKNALISYGRFGDGTLTGEQWYQALADSLYAKHIQGGGQGAKTTSFTREVSELLLSLGIPGIRYLDQGSRGLQIIPPSQNVHGKWLVKQVPNGARYYLGDSEVEARDAFEKAHTYNYVIFDDSKIKITHENGQPVALGEAMESASLGASRTAEDPRQATFDLGFDRQAAETERVPDSTPAAPAPAKSAGELAMENVGLAVTIANDYRNIQGADIQDIVGEAKVALMKAARGFDPTRKESFAAYAGTAIRNRLNELFGKQKRYTQRQALTLDEPAHGEDNDQRVVDTLSDSDADGVAAPIERGETARLLSEAMESLAERPRRILEMRLEGARHEDIGRELGISKQGAAKALGVVMGRVRQILEEKGIRYISNDGVLFASRTLSEYNPKKGPDAGPFPSSIRYPLPEGTPRLTSDLQPGQQVYHGEKWRTVKSVRDDGPMKRTASHWVDFEDGHSIKFTGRIELPTKNGNATALQREKDSESTDATASAQDRALPGDATEAGRVPRHPAPGWVRPLKDGLEAALFASSTRAERIALGRFLAEDVARTPGAFALKLTDEQKTAKTLEDALKAYGVGAQVEQEAGGNIVIRDPRSPVGVGIRLKPGRGKDWQVSSIVPNAETTKTYQAIYTWAHNTGQRIVPDDSYTEEGTFRRISQMLSSVLRHGTTVHLFPHRREVVGLFNWMDEASDGRSAFFNNVGLLAHEESDFTMEKVADLRSLLSDESEENATGSAVQAALHTGENSSPLLPPDTLSDRIDRLLGPEDLRRRNRVGSATAARALLVADWFDGTRSGRGPRMDRAFQGLRRSALYASSVGRTHQAQIDEEARRIAEPTPAAEKEKSELWKDFVAAHLKGRFEKLAHFAPGADDVVRDLERKQGLISASLREFNEGIEEDVRKSFGDPTWWRKPAARERLKQFKAKILPVAARLNPVGYDEAGNFQFEMFWQRAGFLELDRAKKMNVGEKDWIESRGGMVQVRDFLPDLNGYQLERPITAAEQQEIFDSFHKEFPEAAHWLDSYIAPGRDASRVIDERGIRLPDFNRHSLADFYGESPYGEIARLEGYTPDVARTRSIAGMVGSLLRLDWTSPGRERKTGEARERGELRDLFQGFSLRAAQAHEESIRRETAEQLLRTAVQDVPAFGVPDNFRRLDQSFFNPLLRAAESLGADALEELPEALTPEAIAMLNAALNPANDGGKPSLETRVTAANIETLRRLVGDPALFNPRKMVRREIYDELVRSFAQTRVNNKYLAILDGLIKRMTSGYLAHPFSWIQNMVSNEIFKTMRATQRAVYGVLQLASGETDGEKREGRVALKEARNIVTGMMFDRWYNKAARERMDAIAPLELYERNSGIRSITGDDIDQSPAELIKQANVPAAILKAVGYADMDGRAKQQLATASYRAHAEVALEEYEAKEGRLPDKAARQKWMREWIANASPELHRAVNASARLYALDYSNVPWWLDEGSRVEIMGIDMTAYTNMARRFSVPFAKYPYNYLRQMKRLGVDSLLDLTLRRKFKTKEQRRNAAANLSMLAMLGLAARLLLGGDDDEEVSLIGTAYDEEGKQLEAAYNTASRVNVSKTPLGPVVRATARMFGDPNSETDDYWLRIRTLPYANVMLMLTAAETSIRGLATGSRAHKEALKDNLGSMVEDFTSVGLGLSLGMAMFGYKDKYNQRKDTSVMMGSGLTDLTTSGVVPSALRRAARGLADPYTRRMEHSGSLDYEPGFLEGVANEIPGASRLLPAAGRINSSASPSSVKTLSGIAELDSLGLKRNYAATPKLNAKGQLKQAYTNPATLKAQPAWREVLRLAGLNIKAVDPAKYRAEIKGEHDD